MRRALMLSVSLLFLSGCPDEAAPSTPIDVSPGDTELPVDHPDVDGMKSLATSRGSGRLSVNQLRRSLPIVAGPAADGKPVTWGALEGNARGLGEPDYADVTIENYDPSPLYAKFVDDAARDVCNKVLAEDLKKATADGRTVYRFVEPTDTVASNAAGVDQNLRYLKLRFHGVRVADDDPASLAPLRALFSRGVTTAQAGAGTASQAHVREGWRLVCVALMTSAEFHIY